MIVHKYLYFLALGPLPDQIRILIAEDDNQSNTQAHCCF
jgi:hypothetical protein